MYETPDWNHTVYKHPTGAFYAVSERVINSGFVPQDGSIVSSPEERFEFYSKMINGSDQGPPSPEVLEKLLGGLNGDM